MQKIKAHDFDIQGLDWCPTENVPQLLKNEEDFSDLPLAVSSKDKSITIWSSKTAKRLATLKLPKSKFENNQAWITMNWSIPSKIFVSGVQGELFQWDLDEFSNLNAFQAVIKSDASGKEFRMLHWEHSKNLFNIVAFEDFVYTCGYDRSLVCYALKKDAIFFKVPTFGGRILSLANNTVDPSILAIGSGDGQIRIWKTASSKSMFDWQGIWQRSSKAEISAMVWNPEKDGQLVFATDEGRIAYVDALSPRPSPVVMEFKHRGSVYNLAFGPRPQNPNDICLYSLGDGVIMIHASKSEKSVRLEDVVAESNSWQRKPPSRSCMEFKPIDHKVLIVGSDDGSLEVYNTESYKIICTLKSFQKLIQSIAWHPVIMVDNQPSDFKNHVAIASNEYDIHVWNLDEKLNSEEENPIFTKPDIVLSGIYYQISITILPYGPAGGVRDTIRRPRVVFLKHPRPIR